MRIGRWGVAVGVVVTTALLHVPAPASAAATAVPDTLEKCVQRDAADDDITNGIDLPYWFCDDGIPAQGGRTPNPDGKSAIEVPAAYTGPGDPVKDPVAAAQVPGNSNGNVALDVNLSLPDPDRHPVPADGYPLVVFMHGCCAGSKTGWEADTVDEPGSAEKWHYSNAWFASRGYVVITYTARGFQSNGRGSTGETLIDHRSFEMNDFRYLAGLVADNPLKLPPEGGGTPIPVNPQKVLATGGSYGGGFAWLALTVPTWRSPGGRDMALAAVAPRYGWTDLAYSLVPNGNHSEDSLQPADGSATAEPFGFPKRSIVAGLYATGQAGATFQPEIAEAFLCLQSPLPFESNPLCANVRESTLPDFIRDRSAYYQNAFFKRLRADPAAVVPVFSAGALTDPLFPGIEHRRMARRLRSVVPDYPIREYYGDYQHFTQNKRKEWADVCGPDREVCELSDFPGGDLNATPPSRLRVGATTLLNRFVDHYLAPPANPSAPAPELDTTASLQVCEGTAEAAGFPSDEPGERFSAPTFEELAPHTLTLEMTGTGNTTSIAAPNLHAAQADPLANQLARGNACVVHEAPGGAPSAGPGVTTYDSPPLESRATMIGPARVTVPYTATGTELQLNARLYDLDPDGGEQLLVDRGFRALVEPSGDAVFHLLGNGWRFEPGHRIRLELAQDDDPFIKRSNLPSSMTLAGATLELPVREGRVALEEPADPEGRDRGRDRDRRDRGRRPARDRRPAAATAPEAGTGRLPFTGLALAALLAVAAGLGAAGVALRRRSGGRSGTR